MNNIKEEFIMLMKFRDSIESKTKMLDEKRPTEKLEKMVVSSQYFAYRAIMWEIDMFIEWIADEKNKFNRISSDDENI